ncbi:unnamed protein product [Rhodiola kirilowii]
MTSFISVCKIFPPTKIAPPPPSSLSAYATTNTCRPNSFLKFGSLSERKLRSKTTTFLRCARSALETTEDEEWLKRLPDKNKALYSHSLPCIEAWLKQLGFHQSKEDRAVWLIEKPEWHAQLSLDITDLHIRYLKSGPGDLDKDVDRRFSYALSRDDIENAILGGP